MGETTLSEYKNVPNIGDSKSYLGCIKSIFLPRGFPHSVSKDYVAYQFWDSVQALCSSITGALSANAVFKGVGVGDETASALAATTNWILRDGISKCSSIAFAYFKGSKMDSECKKYRLLADGMNDFALGINLMSPFLPMPLRNVVYCLSSICWSIVGIAGGCTRTAMTIHQARKDNASDVQAKDNSQETLVGLLGLILSYFIVGTIGEVPSLVITCFVVFTCLHLFCNYRAVKAVRQEIFNINRLWIVAEHFVKTGDILSVDDANAKEPVVTSLHIPSTIIIGAALDLDAKFVAAFGGVVVSRKPSIISIHLEELFSSEDLVKGAATACLLGNGVTEGLTEKSESFVAKLLQKDFVISKNLLSPLEHRIIRTK